MVGNDELIERSKNILTLQVTKAKLGDLCNLCSSERANSD